MKAIRHLLDTCLKDLVEVQRKGSGIDELFGVLRRILAESDSSDRPVSVVRLSSVKAARLNVAVELY